jgi:hypothetical protein
MVPKRRCGKCERNAFEWIVGIPDRGTGIGCSRGFLRVARHSIETVPEPEPNALSERQDAFGRSPYPVGECSRRARLQHNGNITLEALADKAEKSRLLPPSSTVELKLGVVYPANPL